MVAGLLFLGTWVFTRGESAASASASARTSNRTFSWLVPQKAPASWHSVAPASGGALLYFPSSFKVVHADPGAVSLAIGTTTARYEAYLNVTPREGAETLGHFPDFRLDVLDDDDVAVHEETSTTNAKYKGGRGSCVMDDYVTRVGSNHYREIACLVVGRHAGYVIVAAVLYRDWNAFAPVLRRELEAFALA